MIFYLITEGRPFHLFTDFSSHALLKLMTLLYYGLFRLLAHEYLLEPSLHSCSSSRFSTTYSKTPISTDSEIVCEMGVIVYEMGVIVCEIGVIVCEIG